MVGVACEASKTKNNPTYAQLTHIYIKRDEITYRLFAMQGRNCRLYIQKNRSHVSTCKFYVRCIRKKILLYSSSMLCPSSSQLP